MNCDNCGGPASILTGQTHHYTECGLDNVYLSNLKTLACESDSCKSIEPIIPRLKLVHETIAEAVALQPYALIGAEARFLRKQCRLKAREWAALLRVDVSTLSRWENGEQSIGSQSDALIRHLYFRLLEQGGHARPGPIAERIAAATQPRNELSSVLIDAGNPAI